MQRRFGGGQTTASRIKSLLSYVQAEHGRAQADAFLLSTKLDRDYLDDETRLVPVELWHSALVAFASRFGREAVLRTTHHIVGAENLGAWAHVLRGTADPGGAYRQLELLGGDQGRTERWRTLESGPTFWRGSIRVRRDSAEESDGLCSLARQAELAAVPLLFGLPAGQVTRLASSDGPPASESEEFTVTWRSPSLWPVGVGLAGGGVLGLIASQASRLLEPQFGGAAGVTIGLGMGLLATHEWRRRTQARAHLVRIHALERSQTLRETRDRGTAGFQEGLVVAGQYRLTEKLGVGANGTIWEAERLSDGGLVAVKLLRAAVAHDTVAADRLRREAAALGLAWHPNVVEVFEDGYLPDGTCFLVMERLHGESLANRLHRVGALAPGTLLPMALQICDALGAVHAAGIVHRDLKPSNIFLEQADGEVHPSDHVKLLDFGVARVEWAETRLTNANAPLGTQGYMSPEQEQGLEIDHRSDIFAFGSVIYECLTGEPPPLSPASLWTGERGADSGVHRASVEIPEAWRRLIQRAMSPLPQQRFADSRAMRDALMQLGQKPPESASA